MVRAAAAKATASKTVMINLADENLISMRGLAQVLGLDVVRIRQLEDEGIFSSRLISRKKMYDLQTAVRTYAEYLRKQKKAKPEMPDSARKDKADADWKEARADIEKMRRDELAGKFHSAEDVEAVTSDLIFNIRSNLLAMPGRLAKDIAAESSPTMCSDMIKKEVGSILDELARYKYDPQRYRDRVRERSGWGLTDEDDSDE